MSAFDSLTPSCDQIEKNNALDESNKNRSTWESWYKKFTSLNFTDEVAREYATIFVNNKISISTIDYLDNNILQSMGIDRAGHRTKILRMKSLTKRVSTEAATNSVIENVTQSSISENCLQHPNAAAVNRCHRCKRPVCPDCHRQRTYNYDANIYCEECHDAFPCKPQ